MVKGLDLTFDSQFLTAETATLAGVDEVGRGSLMGPIMAAAVVIDRTTRPITGVNDSKQISPKVRLYLVKGLKQTLRRWAVAAVSAQIIDRWGINYANRLVMAKAVRKICPVDLVLVDGKMNPLGLSGEKLPVKTIIRGDQLAYAVAAASIIAKVTRDELMERWHQKFPVYNWDRNKGYGTPKHLQALKDYGPSPYHRLSFLKQIRELPV